MASTTVEALIPNGERLGAPSDVRPLIHISNASKIFATTDGQPAWALSGVSLDVAPAEFVCVVGPSGWWCRKVGGKLENWRKLLIVKHSERRCAAAERIFDPLHYLPLIEQKIGALDQAAPLAGWDLPEAFITLRRLLEARMGKAGKREYVQVLRLLETFRLEEVEGAVGDALRLGAIGFDAVKHLVLCRIERRPPRLNLDVYPYLPRARVAMTSAKSYMSLLSGLGA